jgi:hypothetical protein
LSPKAKKSSGRGEERRRARRTIVQESFHLFVVIPQLHGMVRIYMRDLSRVGLCFQHDLDSPLTVDQNVSARLYINPGFYLPLECRVARVGGGEVALEFLEPDSPAAQAVAKLQDFFTAAEAAAVLAE